MFSIIISEKGGAERRESYDRTEINVGRVQGNDLMLPKGNVSKRHARLLFRDGRFIVTDLKSTNGTYVNGRKIAQATIVREGDKIYIGDFVLRIEAPADAKRDGDSAAPSIPDEASDNGAPREENYGNVPPPPRVPQQAPYPAQPAASQPAMSQQAAMPPPLPAGGPGGMPPPLPLGQGPMAPVAQGGMQPAPPPMVSPPAMTAHGLGVSPPAMQSQSMPQQANASTAPPAAPMATARPIAPAPPTPPVMMPSAPPPVPTPQPAIASAVPVAMPGPNPVTPSAPAPSSRDSMSSSKKGPPVEPQQVVEHRSQLGKLMERTLAAVDLGSLMSGEPTDAGKAALIDRTLREKASQMRASGEMGPSIDPEVLVAEAKRELIELGPIGPLLDDEDVEEVQVIRHDHVVALRGRNQVATEIAFTSEQAVARVVRRICHRSGTPLDAGEHFVERRLERGGRMFGVLPPASGDAHMLIFRKPQRSLLTLDDLVRTGTMSRGMATLFAQCVAGRANLLVTGALQAGAGGFLAALAGAGSIEDRVIVLQEDDELIFNQPHTVSILLGDTAHEGAQAVRAAIRVRPDRLVVGTFAGHVVAEVVDAIGDGLDGVLAAARAPTSRHLIQRLPADLAATRQLSSVDTAREWLGSAFDLVIEVARLRDGRQRVLRVSEFLVEGRDLQLRDIFTFNVERTASGGLVEGSFQATGNVPRIVEDLAARGAAIDTAVFKRGTG